MKNIHCDLRSGLLRKPNHSLRHIFAFTLGTSIGFLVGNIFPYSSFIKHDLAASLPSSIDVDIDDDPKTFQMVQKMVAASSNVIKSSRIQRPKTDAMPKPRGAESLPNGIIVPETDLYLRRLWGNPSEDFKMKPKYLVTFTVGFDQREDIKAAIEKFSDDFTIVLFHYDGRTNEWDEFEWSKHAIHISARRQTKWWYAKRFLHPDVVVAYDYIFIWDEDLGVEHFNAEKYLELAKKHGLEISQPGIEVGPNKRVQWNMTRRRNDTEAHKAEHGSSWCFGQNTPPCAAFVEIMAPVFSRDAWRCVWYMIQNDLVHGWGLDFALRRCVEPAHEKIGVIDSQWVVHQAIPSLGNQGQAGKGQKPIHGVKKRSFLEWQQFQKRLEDADRAEFLEVASG